MKRNPAPSLRLRLLCMLPFLLLLVVLTIYLAHGRAPGSWFCLTAFAFCLFGAFAPTFIKEEGTE